MTGALVIDDAPDLRFLIREVLTRAGVDVAEAESGAAALRFLAEDVHPDVIILDVQMPDMDGWDTLARIRRDPSTADIAVILCTVKSHPADAARARDLGCDALLFKPFDIRELAAVTLALAGDPHEQVCPGSVLGDDEHP